MGAHDSVQPAYRFFCPEGGEAMPLEILLLTVVKALVELAGLFLLGRGLLYLIAGAKRDTNYFYQLFTTLTGPVIAGARFITPKFVLDRHIPYVAMLLLFWIWLGLIVAMANVCQSTGVDCKALKQGFTIQIPAAQSAA